MAKSLGLSEDRLKEHSQITNADILAAIALWVLVVPARYKTLLYASIVGGEGDSDFAWDAVNGNYVYLKTGRVAPALEIRRNAIEPLIEYSKAKQRLITINLQSKKITLAEWQRQMMESIRITQIAAALAANGGAYNTNENDRRAAALLILALLLLLQGFADDIVAGLPLNGMILTRSDLYANAARGTFEEMETNFMADYLGRTEERRVLGHAEHCHTYEGNGDLIGCVELADMGWRPIRSLPPIGTSPCRSNCKCHKEYR